MSIYETTIKNPKKIAEFYKQLSEQKDIEIKQLKQKLQQKEDIISKAKKFVEEHNKTVGKLYFKCSNMYLLSEIKEDLLKILDNKGE